MKHHKQLLSMFVFLGFLFAVDVQAAQAKSMRKMKAQGKKAKKDKTSTTQTAVQGQASKDIHTLEELNNELAQGKPTILAIHYHQCRHCITSMPYFDQAAKAPQNSDIVFLKAETSHAHDITQKLNINSTPTLIYYNNGEKIFQTIGEFHSAQAVTSPMRQYLKKGSTPSSSRKKSAPKQRLASTIRRRMAAAKKQAQ